MAPQCPCCLSAAVMAKTVIGNAMARHNTLAEKYFIDLMQAVCQK